MICASSQKLTVLPTRRSSILTGLGSLPCLRVPVRAFKAASLDSRTSSLVKDSVAPREAQPGSATRTDKNYFCPACEKLHHHLNSAFARQGLLLQTFLARGQSHTPTSEIQSTCKFACVGLDRHCSRCCPDLLSPLSQAPVSLSTDEARLHTLQHDYTHESYFFACLPGLAQGPCFQDWRRPTPSQLATIEQALTEAREKEMRLRESAVRPHPTMPILLRDSHWQC